MNDDLHPHAEALAEARSYRSRERERRIGTTYLVAGGVAALTFATYAFLQTREDVHSFAWGLAWVPFVAVGAWARHRLFRRLPTPVEDLTGLPPVWGYGFVALWLMAGWGLAGLLDRPRLAMPAILGVFGLLFLVQARRFRDRLHAVLALLVLALAAVLALTDAPPHLATLACGVGLGGALLALGLFRRARARESSGVAA